MSTRRIKKLDSKVKGDVIEKYSTAAKLSLKLSTTLKLHISWFAHRIHHYRFAFRWLVNRAQTQTDEPHKAAFPRARIKSFLEARLSFSMAPSMRRRREKYHFCPDAGVPLWCPVSY